MLDLLKAALPASITLLGALVASAIAYRQWRGKVRGEAAAAFEVERRDAYKALWEKLEDVHAHARSLAVEPAAFDALLREINLQIARAELYLEPGLRPRVGEYLGHLHALGTAAAAQASPEVRREVYITGSGMSPSEAAEFVALRAALDRVDAGREQLLPAFRAALSGDLARSPA